MDEKKYDLIYQIDNQMLYLEANNIMFLKKTQSDIFNSTSEELVVYNNYLNTKINSSEYNAKLKKYNYFTNVFFAKCTMRFLEEHFKK